jgi:hypothetical protein
MLGGADVRAVLGVTGSRGGCGAVARGAVLAGTGVLVVYLGGLVLVRTLAGA